MNETPYQSPIPTPDGNLLNEPRVPLGPVSWKDAPLVVRGWAYPLLWLQGFGLAVSLLTVLVSDDPPAEKLLLIVIHILAILFVAWHARGLKRRARVAWSVQLGLSYLGLLAFPLGTVINIYILSQWSKPPAKAWFGRN